MSEDERCQVSSGLNHCVGPINGDMATKSEDATSSTLNFENGRTNEPSDNIVRHVSQTKTGAKLYSFQILSIIARICSELILTSSGHHKHIKRDFTG